MLDFPARPVLYAELKQFEEAANNLNQRIVNLLNDDGNNKHDDDENAMKQEEEEDDNQRIERLVGELSAEVRRESCVGH